MFENGKEAHDGRISRTYPGERGDTNEEDATGAAAHSDGRYYVTQTSALHFLRNQATGTVRASAWVRHRGKSTVLTAVDITGEGGRLLATGEFTFFCVDKALMDQKAAAEQK